MRSQLDTYRVVRMIIDILDRMWILGAIQLARVPADAMSAGDENVSLSPR